MRRFSNPARVALQFLFFLTVCTLIWEYFLEPFYAPVASRAGLAVVLAMEEPEMTSDILIQETRVTPVRSAQFEWVAATPFDVAPIHRNAAVFAALLMITPFLRWNRIARAMLLGILGLFAYHLLEFFLQVHAVYAAQHLGPYTSADPHPESLGVWQSLDSPGDARAAVVLLLSFLCETLLRNVVPIALWLATCSRDLYRLSPPEWDEEFGPADFD